MLYNQFIFNMLYYIVFASKKAQKKRQRVFCRFFDGFNAQNRICGFWGFTVNCL